MKEKSYDEPISERNLTNARLTLFHWQDIYPARSPDGMLYVFLNDNQSAAQTVIDAYKAYKVKPVLWSKRGNYVEELCS